MRLIDADALLESAKKYVYPSDMTTTIALGIAETWIKDAPAVDAAPVVRCKDCKHYFPDYMNTIDGNVVVYRCELDHDYGRDDYYCADGERADSPTCGPGYCEIGGEDDADGETPLSRKLAGNRAGGQGRGGLALR